MNSLPTSSTARLNPAWGCSRRSAVTPKNTALRSPFPTCPHLSVLVGVVPAGVQVPHAGAEVGGEGVAGLPVRLRDAVVDGVDLLHKVLIELGDRVGSERLEPNPSFMGWFPQGKVMLVDHKSPVPYRRVQSQRGCPLAAPEAQQGFGSQSGNKPTQRCSVWWSRACWAGGSAWTG